MMDFMPFLTDQKNKKKYKGLLTGCLTVLFWCFIWQIGAIAVGSDLILPSPVTTLKTVFELMGNKDFLILIGSTLGRVFGGILLFSFTAFGLGMLSGLFRPLENLLKPFASITRTLPVVSVIILINLWVKSEMVPLIVTFLMCFPIVWTNTVAGVRNTDVQLLEMAKVYKVRPPAVLKHIYLPSVKPYLNAAMINAVGMSWKATVTAEVLANTRPSVGMALYYSKVNLETPVLFAWTLLLILISLIIEWGAKKLLSDRRIS